MQDVDLRMYCSMYVDQDTAKDKSTKQRRKKKHIQTNKFDGIIKCGRTERFKINISHRRRKTDRVDGLFFPLFNCLRNNRSTNQARM